MRLAVVLLAAIALVTGACTYPATDVQVHVNTDLPPTPNVTMSVWARRGNVMIDPSTRADLVRAPTQDAGFTFPQIFLVTPQPEDPRDETVTLLIEVSAPGAALRRLVRFRFIPHTTQTLFVFLPVACASRDTTPGHTCGGAPCSREVYCESIGETCGDDGSCVGATVDTFADAGDVSDMATDHCVPATCDGRCGVISDGCGRTITCPGCTGSFSCSDAGTCVCPPPTCAAGQCGRITSACGSATTCPSCPTDTVCNASNFCECVQPTCGALQCGTISNACGHVDCPACPTDYSCNGNTCVCVPPSCNPGQCGTISNSCTSTTCPGCPPDYACSGNGCVCSPSANGVCTPGCSNICNDPDCGAHCGNGVCDCGEDATTCGDCVCQIRCCDDTLRSANLVPGGNDCFWYAATGGGDLCGSVGAYRWHGSNGAGCHVRASACPGCPSSPGVSCPNWEWCIPPDTSACTSPYECDCLTSSCCNGSAPIVGTGCFR